MRGHRFGHHSGVDDTLALLAPTVAGVGTQYVFVYRPGYTGSAPNVYASWPALGGSPAAPHRP